MQAWRSWWEQAEDDWATFEILATTTQHAAACFYAQQAAEKAIKAVVSADHGHAWGHS